MKHILPLGESPILGYQHHAYTLSISALHPSFHDWFYSNYIQLCFYKDSPSFNFYQFSRLNPSPFLGEMYLHKTLVTRYVDLLQFIIDSLNDNNYIVTFADEYYVPNRSAFQKFNLVHDVLIYGYCLDRNVLYIAGYNDMTYGFSEINFEDFESAFININNQGGNLVKWANGIHLFQLKLDNQFHFDLTLIIELLEDYLYSHNSSNRFKMYENPDHHVYGLHTYDLLIEYLEKVDDQPIDLRMFHIFYEHKKVMVNRLKYLHEVKKIKIDTNLISEYSNQEKESLLLRNLCLKANIKKNINIVSTIVEQLKKMREHEINIVSQLLHNLRANLT
ncbi:hypothetical protein DFQ01_11770 [Paenibacillus cellulosilyticus]|uniref:Butirosin biosynthesis protein H-like n=1 Tax=Paenibacillus cellulosilyticus TaxID=375489 RepID=A0A2V2YPW7_9BACL|nr:hypothetical protein [Paenibacillus cellulosilyticus]PWV98560.1 hypothetical protein DFQ01_11770 [Paenibacillus cellulosilyticus]QKS44165.1 hypothetical protein HUB94_06750 [Paenibacillus cellulosilyticus]